MQHLRNIVRSKLLLSSALIALACFASCDKENLPETSANMRETIVSSSSDSKTAHVTIVIGTRGLYDEECLCCVYIDERHINCQMITVISELQGVANCIEGFTDLVGQSASMVGSYFRGDDWKQWYPELINEPVLDMLQDDECIIVCADTKDNRIVYQAVDCNDSTDVIYSFCFDFEQR